MQEFNKVSAISFVSGLPGGVAMFGTVPADLAQYSGHILRILQKVNIFIWLGRVNFQKMGN